MPKILLDDFLQQVAKRKRDLIQAGILPPETEEYVDSLRNKGENRTPEKRELLNRIKERSDGKMPKSYW